MMFCVLPELLVRHRIEVRPVRAKLVDDLLSLIRNIE